MQHIAALIGAAALACVASTPPTQPEPQPEPKKVTQSVVRLKTVDGAVKVLIQFDDGTQELIANRVELLDDDGNLTAKFGVDQKGMLRLMNVPLQLPPVRLGVTTEVIPEPLAVQLDIEPVQGLLVTNLVDGLPAAKGGLKRYDVLIAIDDESPVTQQTLRQRVQVCQPGERIKLRVVRKGEPIELVIVAEEQDPEQAVTFDWTVDSSRRYYEALVDEPGEKNPVRWTATTDGAGIAQYRVLSDIETHKEVTTSVIATENADGGLLLEVRPIVYPFPDVWPVYQSARPSVVPTISDYTVANEHDAQAVRVVSIDPDDPMATIRAQIDALKQELAALEALVNQIEWPRD
jgi:PDZ domain